MSQKAQKKTCTWKSLSAFVLAELGSPAVRTGEFVLPDQNVIEAYMRRTIEEFYSQAGGRKTNIKHDVQCGVCDYPLDIANCQDILSVDEVRFFRQPPKNCGDRGQKLTAFEDYERCDDMLILSFSPNCDIQDGLLIKIKYLPELEGQCEVPTEFCGRYKEALISGTLRHLYRMTNMDWANAGLADLNELKFLGYVKEAREENLNDRIRGKRNFYSRQKTRWI